MSAVSGSSAETPHCHFGALILYMTLASQGHPSSFHLMPPPPTDLTSKSASTPYRHRSCAVKCGQQVINLLLSW